MNGPKILSQPSKTASKSARKVRRMTGIRLNEERCSWIAIRSGRFVGEWSGIGARTAAIRAAGSDKVLS